MAPRRPGWREHDASEPYRIVRTGGGLDAFPFLSIPTLIRLFRREDPDAVFCIQWNALLAVRLAGLLHRGRRPVGLAAHGRELLFCPFDRRVPSDIYRAIRSWALSGASSIFAVSRYTAQIARGHDGVPDRVVHVVPNGVDASRFDPAQRAASRAEWRVTEQQIILTVCRLVPRKGVDVLIESLDRIRERFPLAELWVVGDGPELPRLEDLTVRLGLSDRVRFLGRVEWSRLPTLFQAADVFAMVPRHEPPDVEGFGLVFLEASAAAVPTVGSRAGGIEDAVLDGKTGILVPPADVAATAEAVARLLGDAELALRLGRNGRAHAAGTATWARVANEIASVLLEDQESI